MKIKESIIFVAELQNCAFAIVHASTENLLFAGWCWMRERLPDPVISLMAQIQTVIVKKHSQSVILFQEAFRSVLSDS